MAKEKPLSLTIPTKHFREALSQAAAIAPARTNKELLKNVKLEISTDAARLIATDSETSIRCELADFEAEGAGDVLLPPARLKLILGELHDEHLSIEVDEKRDLWVRAGLGSEWKLSTEDPKEFPPVPSFDAADYFTLSAADLAKAIERTIFATDQESTRYALGGVLVELDSGKASAVFAATDSRRLAVVEIRCGRVGNPTCPTPAPVVPAKAMKLLQSTASGDEVKVSVTANTTTVQCGRFTVSSQLVQGTFPNWRRVIPTPEVSIATVVGPFHSAIRQAQIVTNEESRGVDFTFSKGTLRLSSQAADIGQSKIELPISYDGADRTIAFDPRYIGDCLRVLGPSETVDIKVTDSDSAALITTADGYRYVIMPLSKS